jgi:hypothetical protein
VVNVKNDSAVVSWSIKSIKYFLNYKVFIGQVPLIDSYYNDNIVSSARLVKTISDIHTRRVDIDDLSKDTNYYVLIVLTEQNGRKAINQANFTTGVEEYNEGE